MLKSILGHKIGMTQIFDKIGNRVPITLLTVGPCFVTQIKTIKLNGYNAIQLGYSLTSLNKLTNSKIGHLKKSNNYSLKYLREYKVDNTDNFKLGQIISINLFKDMNFVDISAKNIGKGFSGNQKRHNFSRGLMTHGSKNHRSPGLAPWFLHGASSEAQGLTQWVLHGANSEAQGLAPWFLHGASSEAQGLAPWFVFGELAKSAPTAPPILRPKFHCSPTYSVAT